MVRFWILARDPLRRRRSPSTTGTTSTSERFVDRHQEDFAAGRCKVLKWRFPNVYWFSGSLARGRRPRSRCAVAGSRSSASTPPRTWIRAGLGRPVSNSISGPRRSDCSTPSRLCQEPRGTRRGTARRRPRESGGIPVWSEVELGSRLLSNPILGVTGTNGKTTTSELLGVMLGAPVAGNVGRALTDLDGQVEPDQIVVCEVSSFQLEDVHEFRPRVAVLLNLEPDHLDRHGSLEAYRDAKLRIFENQGEGDTAIVPLGFDEVPGHGAEDRVRSSRSAAGRAENPRRAQPRERRGGHGGGPRARDRRLAHRRCAGELPGRRPSPRAGRRGGRRALRERLQGDEHRCGQACCRGLRRAAPRHPRRARQGRELHRACARPRRASRARVRDRRGRRRHRIRARAGGRRPRAERRPRDGRSGSCAQREARATSSCSLRPAPATTSSTTSRSAATRSGAWRKS